MTPAARRTAGAVLLALAGLVVAVALGVIVASSVSHSVALGGVDLGSGSNLVLTPTAVTPVSPPGPGAARIPSVPSGGTGHSDHDGDNGAPAGRRPDHDADD